MFINKKNNEFHFGKDDFLGSELACSCERLVQGILAVGGSASGKTNRVMIPFFSSLLRLRMRQHENERWGALILDPKISFASRLIDLVHKAGMKDDLDVLNEHQQITLNPLLSGLDGQKLAEFIVRSLHAGKPMSMSSGAAYFESRALALLGNLITVALFASRPCLKLVSEMVDALILSRQLDSSDPRASDALRRIEIFSEGEEKERRMVLDSVSNYIEPFRHMPWKNIFWEFGPFNLDRIRDEGRILIAAFSPNKVNHLSSGLFLVKMLFYSVVMDRQSIEFNGNRERICLFAVDEFQQVASGNSDADFLAVRREARCAPIFAFQQITQLESIIPNDWKNVLGLLNTKIVLRLTDMETALWAEKLCGFNEEDVDSVTRVADSMQLFYHETSLTTSPRTQPRVPADYFLSLPDGDALIINDRRRLAWLPAHGMTPEQEINWRKKYWPDRLRLLHPRDFRQ